VLQVSTSRDVVLPTRSREGKANMRLCSHRQGWLLPLHTATAMGMQWAIGIRGPRARIGRKSKKDRTLQASRRSTNGACAQPAIPRLMQIDDSQLQPGWLGRLPRTRKGTLAKRRELMTKMVRHNSKVNPILLRARWKARLKTESGGLQPMSSGFVAVKRWKTAPKRGRCACRLRCICILRAHA
jgi:hypothetical protein